MLQISQAFIWGKTGDWWQDDRRNWCAYCGVAICAEASPTSCDRLTRDHVIPRAHKGRHVTIPACKQCNAAKGSGGLPEFMASKAFEKIRATPRPNRWPSKELWLVLALAAVEQARGPAQPRSKKATPPRSAHPAPWPLPPA